MTPSDDRETRIKTIKDIFVSLMWVAARQFSQRVQSFGLTHPQFIVLATLVAHKQACTMRDLTNVTFQDPPTMTGIVDRLVKIKLIKRTRSESDRRVVLVEATLAGAELVKQIEEASINDDIRGFSKFSDKELDNLEQSLRYLLRMHVGRYAALRGAELDAEIEKLQNFRNDPIQYMKSKT